MINLDESLFDDDVLVPDVKPIDITIEEIIPEGPAPGSDTGVANLLTGAIADCWAEVSQYNSYIVTIGDNYPEICEVLKKHVAERTTQIGELQAALQSIAPNTQNVIDGAMENINESLFCRKVRKR